jgi:hypothetical protein
MMDTPFEALGPFEREKNAPPARLFPRGRFASALHSRRIECGIDGFRAF